MSGRKLWGCLSITVILTFDQPVKNTIAKINAAARLSRSTCYVEIKKLPVDIRELETEWIHYIDKPFLMHSSFYECMFNYVRNFNTIPPEIIRIDAPGVNILFKTCDMTKILYN